MKIRIDEMSEIDRAIVAAVTGLTGDALEEAMPGLLREAHAINYSLHFGVGEEELQQYFQQIGLLAPELTGSRRVLRIDSK
jgi:hypothetical protein